jgi:hypothetical protein
LQGLKLIQNKGNHPSIGEKRERKGNLTNSWRGKTTMGDGMPSSPLSSLPFFFISSLGAKHKRVMAARGGRTWLLGLGRYK